MEQEHGMSDPDGNAWVLDVRVELVETDPLIWRRLELLGSLSLDRVHEALQTAFGWEDLHLHRFTDGHPFMPLRPVNGEYPDPPQWMPRHWCEEPTDLAEEGCTLQELFTSGSGTAFYEYDFGDSWLHRLDLVSRRPARGVTPPALLVDGARRGPLEDCGGFPGYEELLDALADPTHPQHTECVEWVADMTGTEEAFDAAFLDVAAVNCSLAAATLGLPSPTAPDGGAGASAPASSEGEKPGTRAQRHMSTPPPGCRKL
ncbi:plasmid pRiA4b ORF-3 family protein [Arthrobacter sp. NPDC056727]|uniref:plasmid pRiA4b ORF-3 family protein n=1 Tax=Arthrobacter sp. NPDC056727 TaxID=3345927 RepID=UPI003671F2CF